MPTSLQTPQTLPTAYTQGATLGPIQNLEKIVWQNTGGVVLFQVASLDPSGKPVFDQTEAALPPGIWGMDKIQGIRFRSRDVAALATLDPCTGYFEDDPDPFNPGNIPGSTAAITGAVNVQHNGALVASQPTLDFIDSADGSFAWNINNDGPNTRVTITEPNVVSSFNTRTGSVVPITGDYTAAQVTNAADKASASTQFFTGAVYSGNNPGLPTALTGAGIQSTGLHRSIVATTGTVAFEVDVANSADTVGRFAILGDGTIQWGAGNASRDISLTRAVLNTVSSLQVTAGDGISNGGVPNSLTSTGWAVWSSVMTVVGTAAGNNTYLGGIQNEATYRWRITTDGSFNVGGGAVATDTSLSRAVTNPTPAHWSSNASIALTGSVYPALSSTVPVPTTSVTPDYDADTSFIYSIGGTGGGTLTVNNPTNPPSASQTGYMYIQISNPPGNTATALSFGGAFSFLAVGGAPASVAQSGFWRLFFVWNGAAWMCLIKINL